MVRSKRKWVSVSINQVINLIFTAIFFYPVVLFWFKFYQTQILLVLLGISMIPFFIPPKLYRYTQLSKSRAFYKSLAIDKFQHITQQGKFAKRLIRYVSDKESFLFEKKSLKNFKNQIRAFESYHFACLIFFFGTFIYALIMAEYILASVIFIANVLYNVIPILIQQYNKARISGFLI